MPICRHGKEMHLEGNKWVCEEGCLRDVSHKVLSHADALTEVERLRPFESKYYNLLEALTNHCADNIELEDLLHSEMANEGH